MSTDYVKKLGDPRPATVEVKLTEEQRAERRTQACALRDQQKALTQEAKLAADGYRQRKKALENEEDVLRQQASTGIETAAVIVQHFLTAQNEVVAVRIDNGALVAKRTATADELQEEMFGGTDDEENPH
jgi:hypothetical protein